MINQQIVESLSISCIQEIEGYLTKKKFTTLASKNVLNKINRVSFFKILFRDALNQLEDKSMESVNKELQQKFPPEIELIMPVLLSIGKRIGKIEQVLTRKMPVSLEVQKCFKVFLEAQVPNELEAVINIFNQIVSIYFYCSY